MSYHSKPLILQKLENKDNFYNKMLYLFKDTASGQLVVLFWVVFSIQFIAYPLFVESILTNNSFSPLWSALFTVSLGSEYYVWTYVTSIFSHGNLIHLLFNSIVLLSFGLYIENSVGKKKFVMLFLLFGILSNLSQILIVTVAHNTELISLYSSMDNEFMILGASGAIMGIIGIDMIKNPSARISVLLLPFISFKLIHVLITVLIINILIIFYFGVGAFNIAHTAHISGFLIGAIYGIQKFGWSMVKYELINY